MSNFFRNAKSKNQKNVMFANIFDIPWGALAESEENWTPDHIVWQK